MTKNTARLLALICTLGTLVLLFQARIITPAGNSHEFIFSVPGDADVEASVSQDLQAQLEKHFDIQPYTQELGHTTVKNKPATVSEALTYEVSFLGRTFSGDRYILCSAVTTRTAVGDNGKLLDAATHSYSFTALEPAAAEGQTQVFWDSQTEDYQKNEAAFARLAEGM